MTQTSQASFDTVAQPDPLFTLVRRVIAFRDQLQSLSAQGGGSMEDENAIIRCMSQLADEEHPSAAKIITNVMMAYDLSQMLEHNETARSLRDKLRDNSVSLFDLKTTTEAEISLISEIASGIETLSRNLSKSDYEQYRTGTELFLDGTVEGDVLYGLLEATTFAAVRDASHQRLVDDLYNSIKENGSYPDSSQGSKLSDVIDRLMPHLSVENQMHRLLILQDSLSSIDTLEGRPVLEDLGYETMRDFLDESEESIRMRLVALKGGGQTPAAAPIAAP